MVALTGRKSIVVDRLRYNSMDAILTVRFFGGVRMGWFSRHYSTNATMSDGVLTFRPMKYFLFEPEALAEPRRKKSASASGSESQGFAMQNH